MSIVTLNFRDQKTETPATTERVLVVYDDMLIGGMSADVKDAEDVTDDEYWIPMSEVEDAIKRQKEDNYVSEQM